MKNKHLLTISLLVVVAALAVNGMRLATQNAVESDELTLDNVEQLSNAEVVVTYSGYVGIFTWNPQYVLEIGTTGQSLVAKINGSWIMTSDSRAKKNISPLSNTLDAVSQLRGVSYNWLSPLDPALADREVYGFVAEEVQAVLPELVYADGEGNLAMDYNGIIPLLTTAIQEQQRQIETLQSQVSALLALRSSADATDAKAATSLSAALFQNSPNPASPNTEIRYSLPADAASAFIMAT